MIEKETEKMASPSSSSNNPIRGGKERHWFFRVLMWTLGGLVIFGCLYGIYEHYWSDASTPVVSHFMKKRQQKLQEEQQAAALGESSSTALLDNVSSSPGDLQGEVKPKEETGEGAETAKKETTEVARERNEQEEEAKNENDVTTKKDQENARSKKEDRESSLSSITPQDSHPVRYNFLSKKTDHLMTLSPGEGDQEKEDVLPSHDIAKQTESPMTKPSSSYQETSLSSAMKDLLAPSNNEESTKKTLTGSSDQQEEKLVISVLSMNEKDEEAEDLLVSSSKNDEKTSSDDPSKANS